jgi:hypothetical protein
MRLHKHWLDYDVAALAFVIVGIAATISSLGELGPRPAGAIFLPTRGTLAVGSQAGHDARRSIDGAPLARAA